MSSSRVIKSAAASAQTEEFYLGELRVEGEGRGERFHTLIHGFQPLCGDIPPAPVAAEPEPPVDIAELLAGMVNEEELQRQVQDAYDSGFAEGRRQFEEEFAGICHTLSRAAAELYDVRERVVRECEEDLFRLAIMVAERIIRQEISLDRSILAGFVSEALESIDAQEELVIRFNPEDYRMVTENRSLDFGSAGDTRKITLKPDESITPGGCIIDALTGQVDGRIEAQLAEIFERLMEERALSHLHPDDPEPGAEAPPAEDGTRP